MRNAGSVLFRFRAHILVDAAVISLVLALPLSLGGAPATAGAVEPAPVAAAAETTTARASTVARGATITAATAPATSVADDVRPIVHYRLGPADTLETLANFFDVTPEVIAFSNGITDPTLQNQQGREILIPPGQGALYTVQPTDTLASVAERFKVDVKPVMDYNRLYFEPEHFAPGQLIFVPGAAVPALVRRTADPEETVVTPTVVTPSVVTPTALARPAPAGPAPNGKLAWPVGGIITQYYWAYHTGVDLAAPYGTGIGASDDGTVVFEGWVPVGGISVRIQHANGLETGYYHMAATFVGVGQKVKRGQIIGTIGMTGVTTGPHVHWEVKLNGRFLDPLRQ